MRSFPLSGREGFHRTTPPMRSCTPLATSSSESGSPEASTPQHLPPLAFLRPSTVFSSDDEPVLFHTGTASRVQRTGTDSPACSAFLIRVRRKRRGPKGRQNTRTIRVTTVTHLGRYQHRTTARPLSQPQPVMPMPTSHSPASPRKTTLGGGPIDEPCGPWPN